MEPLMELHILVPVDNRPGVFAVLPPPEAQRLKQGYMKLYWRRGALWCETITRARSLLPAPLVFVSVDQNGRIVTEVLG